MGSMLISKSVESYVDGRLDAIDRMFRPSSDVFTDVGDMVYEKLFGQYEADMRRLPSEFFKYHEYLHVVSFEGRYVSAPFKLSRERPFPMNAAVPPHAIQCAVPSGPTLQNYFRLNQSSTWDTVRPRMKEYIAQLDEHFVDTSKFKTDVRALMKNNRSVSRIVTVWPAFLALLPPDMRAAYAGAKRRKSRKAVVPAGVDLEKMTAKVTAYSMLKATQGNT